MQASTVNTDFNGAILGSFIYGTSIKLAGAEIKTYKNGSENISGATLFYRVYSITPGAFSNTNLPFGSNLGNGDQSWTATGADIELSKTLSPGTYTIELYTTATFTFTGGGETHFSNNGGNNYKATFTITTAPLTITGLSGSNKTYDGNTTASLSGTAAYSGLVNSENFSVTGTPSASFNTAAIGTGKPITVTGYTAPNSNYTVSQPIGLTANIIALTAAEATNYQSRGTGNLTTVGTWEYNRGDGAFVTSTIVPVGKNITIQNGHAITLDADYTVASGKTFTIASGGSLIVNAANSLTIAGTADFGSQSVTLLSTSINNGGTIGTISGTLSGASNVTVQRYTQAQRGYRTFGNPLTTAQALSQLTDNFQITGLTTGSPTGFGTANGNVSAFIYNATAIAPTNPLTRLSSASATSWGVGKSLYVFVRGNEGNAGSYAAGTINGITQPGGISAVTVDVTGTVNQGQVDVAVDFLSTADNYNLIANPYPSAINLQNVVLSDASTLASNYGTIYTYSPMTGASSSTVSVGGFTATSTSGNPSIIIPSMGAFYVLATSAKTIRFQETAKTTTAPTLGLFGTGSQPRFKLNISAGSVSYDNLQIGYNNTSTSLSGDFYDGYKLANAALDFYSLSADKKALAIDYRKEGSADIIPLGIKTTTLANYTISLSELTDLPNTQLVLKDKFLKTETILSQVGDSYSFDITSDTATLGENRFEIGLLGTTVLPVQIADITAQLQTNKTVAVNWTSTTEVNLANYKVQRSKDGSNFSTVGTVAAKGASAYSYSDDLSSVISQLSTIYYRLEAVDKDGSKTYSKVVAVALGNSVAKASVNIYPNPVQSTLFAQVTVTKAGAAQLKVVDAQGKIVATQKTQLAVGTTSISIPAAQLSAGSYTLEIRNRW